MADDFPKVLVLDSTRNMVTAAYDIDAKEMIKNGPGRYSVVAWAQSSVPSGQLAAVQGVPGYFALAHTVGWSHPGTPSR